MQQRDAPRKVIEDEQRLGGHIHALRQAGELALVRRQPLEEAHDVIARGADEAAVERDALDLRLQRRRAVEHAAHQREPFGGVLGPLLALAVDREAIGVELEREARAEPEERVAGEPFAAFHALEQETRVERLQLHVRRYRRIEIGGYVERRFHDEAAFFLLAPETKNPSPGSARWVCMGKEDSRSVFYARTT